MSVLPGVYNLEPILSNCTIKNVVSAKIPQFLYSMANTSINYCCLFSGWGIWMKNQSFMPQTWMQPWFACWLVEKCAFTFLSDETFPWWIIKWTKAYTVVTMVHICKNNRFKFITLCIVAGKSLPPCEVFHRKLGTLASAGFFSWKRPLFPKQVSSWPASWTKPTPVEFFMDSPLFLFLLHGPCLHR